MPQQCFHILKKYSQMQQLSRLQLMLESCAIRPDSCSSQCCNVAPALGICSFASAAGLGYCFLNWKSESDRRSKPCSHLQDTHAHHATLRVSQGHLVFVFSELFPTASWLLAPSKVKVVYICDICVALPYSSIPVYLASGHDGLTRSVFAFAAPGSAAATTQQPHLQRMSLECKSFSQHSCGKNAKALPGGLIIVGPLWST